MAYRIIDQRTSGTRTGDSVSRRVSYASQAQTSPTFRPLGGRTHTSRSVVNSGVIGGSSEPTRVTISNRGRRNSGGEIFVVSNSTNSKGERVAPNPATPSNRIDELIEEYRKQFEQNNATVQELQNQLLQRQEEITRVANQRANTAEARQGVARQSGVIDLLQNALINSQRMGFQGGRFR